MRGFLSGLTAVPCVTSLSLGFCTCGLRVKFGVPFCEQGPRF